MHFHVKMPENSEMNTFRLKQTTNKVLLFLEVKMLLEREQLRFSTLSTNKQGTVYVFSV